MQAAQQLLARQQACARPLGRQAAPQQRRCWQPPAAAAPARQQQQPRRQQQHRTRPAAAAPGFGALADSSGSAPSPISGQALQEYFELEQSGLTAQSVGNLRLKYGMRRSEDGRVQVRARSGVWFQVKLDMEVKGTMLLRNTDSSTIYVLQSDKLEQFDLSDDYLLLMLFADGSWEDQMLPIQLADESGETTTLELAEQQFKDFVGLLKTLQEMADASYEEQQALGGRAAAAAQATNGRGGDDAIDVTAEPAP